MAVDEIVDRCERSNRCKNALEWRHGESPPPPAVLRLNGCCPGATCGRAARKASFPSLPVLVPRHHAGVATLIIVMAVMNGFRKELIDKIVGMNGHLVLQPIESR